jgi:Trypsin
MLYKLASPASSQSIVPLNTNPNNPKSNGGDTLTVMGFGSTYEGGSGSFRLQEVEVKHVSQNTCNFAYLNQVEEDIMFCAGVDGGGKDTCQVCMNGAMLRFSDDPN